MTLIILVCWWFVTLIFYRTFIFFVGPSGFSQRTFPKIGTIGGVAFLYFGPRNVQLKRYTKLKCTIVTSPWKTREENLDYMDICID